MGLDILKLFKDEVEMAEEDLLAMEHAVTDYYEDKLSENFLFYSSSPERLAIHDKVILDELANMLEEFKEVEAFEKCSVTLRIFADINSKIKSRV